MNIQAITNKYQYKTHSYYSSPSFNGLIFKPKTLSTCNIGKMRDGIIGKVAVEGVNGSKRLLDVEKITNKTGLEFYAISDKSGGILGEIEFEPIITNDAKYIWIEHLVSHYNKFLEWGNYKGIGTRLLQIALKRSEEVGCGGNIEFFTTETGKAFYKKNGFKNYFSNNNYYEQTRMYLPEEGKTCLKNKYGGL